MNRTWVAVAVAVLMGVVAALPSPARGAARLWVASSGGVVGYEESALGARGRAEPAVFLPGGELEGLAVDPRGNLWASDFKSRQLVLFRREGNHWAAVRASALYPGAGGSPLALAFAPNGDLWVGDGESGALARFTPAQQAELLAGRTAKPSILVAPGAGDRGGVTHPIAMAFDSSGNLWVANLFGRELVELGRLGNGGLRSSPIAMVADGADGLLTDLCGMAFDGEGQLWVTTLNHAVIRLPVRSVRGVQTVAPTAVLRNLDGGAPYLNLPSGIALDARGDLWVHSRDGLLARIHHPTALKGTVQPAADVVHDGGRGTDLGTMQFDSQPTGVAQFP